MATLHLSAGALCDQIEAVTGVTTAGNALGYLNAGYRRFLQGINPQTQVPHIWSFLRPLATLTVGSSVAGTATSVSGTVTATSAVFNISMLGLTMTVTDYDGAGNDLTTTITSVTSPTVVVVAATDNWASKTIAVAGNGILDLPADYGGMVDRPVFRYDSTLAWPRLQESSPEDILDHWRLPIATAEPRYYAVVPKAFAATTGDRWELWLAPVPTTTRYMQYRYAVKPDALTDEADVYPLGGYDAAMKALALAAWEADTASGNYWQGQADIELLRAIEHDAAWNTTASACSMANVRIGIN